MKQWEFGDALKNKEKWLVLGGITGRVFGSYNVTSAAATDCTTLSCLPRIYGLCMKLKKTSAGAAKTSRTVDCLQLKFEREWWLAQAVKEKWVLCVVATGQRRLQGVYESSL